MLFTTKKLQLPDVSEALTGRMEKMLVINQHFVKKTPIQPPFPAGMKKTVFGLGCFWEAERTFWETDGVYSTAAGYAGGHTPNPNYQEVCTGMTGHAEVVLVVYDSGTLTYQNLLDLFWSSHDPTQGMRQSNDIGTQYRSVVGYYDPQQEALAKESKQQRQHILSQTDGGRVTTEIIPAPEFFYAESYHQQYVAKRMG